MKLLRKLLALFRKEKLDREMAEEMRHHLELAAQENLARGLPAADAAPAAQRSFGHIEGYKEEIREQRGLPWLEHILQDFGYGFRLLRKSPGFTAVTVLTLALGIGATAAIFTVVNSVILQPLPYRDSARVVGLGESFKGQPPNNGAWRVSFREWKEQATSFETIGAAGGWPRTFTGLGLPIRIYGWRVTAGYFPTLGVQPVLGRNFRPEEFVAGKGNVLILNHRLWVSSFDRRPDIIGQQVRIDDQPYTIIGVMPPNLWPEPIKDPEFFAPEPESVSDVGLFPRYWDVVTRLKPGVTIAQADREIAEISRRTALKFPDTNKDWSGHAVPAIDLKVGTVKPLLFLLLGAVGFLLLISCVNVANLLLARASTRAKEIAVRIALGASRRRIISQLLCESLLISAAGSVLGIILAYAGLQLLADSAPLSMPRAHEIAIDGWVLAFSCALAACTGLGFGLAPALQASRINPQQAMRDHGRGNTGTSGALKLRSVLVAFEVSLALVLLMVAGLLIHSFLRLQQVPLGFQTNTCYLAKIILPASRYPTAQSQNLFATQVTERLTAVPGVHSVVFASHFPGFSGNDRPFRVDSRPDLDPANLPVASTYVTTPALFDALNMRLVQGRLLETRDTADRAPVAVVSRGFAAKFFPGQNPLGQRITPMSDVHDTSSREIVGVVDDIHDRGQWWNVPTRFTCPTRNPRFRCPTCSSAWTGRSWGWSIRCARRWTGSIPRCRSPSSPSWI